MAEQDLQEEQAHEQAVTDVTQAIRALGELGERVAYGTMAFGSTVILLKVGFHIEIDRAVEPAVLNAGIAYYTHEATGRIIRAITILITPAARRAVDALPIPPKGRSSAE
jgi:hypothetical protein